MRFVGPRTFPIMIMNEARVYFQTRYEKVVFSRERENQPSVVPRESDCECKQCI